MKSIKILLFLLATYNATSQSIIEINAGESALIGNDIDYYIDTTNQIEIEEIKSASFVKSNNEILNLSFMPHTVWIRFDLRSKSENAVYLEIDNALIENLEVFEVVNDSTTNKLFEGGFSAPFNSRQIKTENWLFNIQLEGADISKTIYIKGQTGFPFQVPITVSAKERYVELTQQYKLFWGIYIGIMIFAFLYNLFILFSIKERTYFYYILYILGSTIFYLGLHGYTFKYLWPNMPYLNPILPVIICITNIIITLFTLRFLNITKQQKVSYYGAWTIIIGFALIAIVNFIAPYMVAVALAQMFSLVTALFFIYLGFSSWKRNVPTAKFYLIAWTVYLIFVIIFLLTDNNVLPSTFFTRHCIFIGHMTEVLLLSLALADRINWLKKDNEQKQHEIIKQLEEKELIQLNANRELERKVVERTAEVVEQRNEALKQKERSDGLLLNILPEETAEELKSTGTAMAKYFDNVTVMFADVKDFTQKAEKLDPQELVREVNELFTTFDNIVEKYNIEKIKTIGDAYMAVGGLPSPNETHPYNVVDAALEMQSAIDKLSKKKAAENKDQFKVRIGIHTGPVVAGVVGKKKFAYDIWGTTVNIASRIEGLSEVGRINISESTYNLVKDKYKCEERGKIDAKSIGAINMYYVNEKSLEKM